MMQNLYVENLVARDTVSTSEAGWFIMAESLNADGPNSSSRLEDVLEQWYGWLTTDAAPLFTADDAARMSAPVSYFHQAVDWLSRTTLSNTEWFFKEGSQIVMNRWLKDDYDAYE